MAHTFRSKPEAVAKIRIEQCQLKNLPPNLKDMLTRNLSKLDKDLLPENMIPVDRYQLFKPGESALEVMNQ